MASAEFTLNVANLPEVKALVEAATALMVAENAGADVYEAGEEVEAIRQALAGLGIRVSSSLGTFGQVQRV